MGVIAEFHGDAFGLPTVSGAYVLLVELTDSVPSLGGGSSNHIPRASILSSEIAAASEQAGAAAAPYPGVLPAFGFTPNPMSLASCDLCAA